MALSHSPQIVRDGLVLYLDPANPKSYPGSGTTVFNLGSNGINSTLVNGPTISNRVFVLDGINDYIDTNNASIDLGQTISYEFVLKVNTVVENKVLFGKYGGPGGSDMWIGITASTQRLTAFYYSLQTSVSVTDNTYKHYCLTYSTATGNSRIYINGILNASTNIGARTNPVGNLMIGRFGIASSFYFPGELGFAKIYNTELTEQQVKQNFNATRGRYGI